MAHRAAAILFQPQVDQLASPLDGIQHGRLQPCFEVRFPLGIEGVGGCLDLTMPPNRHVRDFVEHMEFGLAVGESSACFRGEDPVPKTYCPKILPSDPACSFARMPATRPSPQRLPYLMIDFAENLLGDHMAIVVGPTVDHRIEQPYQIVMA